MPRTDTLTSRVLFSVLAILLLGGLLVATSTWWNGRQAARQAYDGILLGAASDIAESIRVQNGAPVVFLPISAFDLLAQAPDDRIYYAVHGPDGEIITGLDIGVTLPNQTRERTRFFDASLSGEPARFARIDRRFAEREFSGTVTVIVGQTLGARNAMTRSLSLDALLPMGVAGLALLLIASAVVSTALRPLDAITEDMARRDPYDLTAIPTGGLPRELQVMLGAMNRFMGRLDGQVEVMRTLISDTAHQLRTPVAAIRIQAESALSEPEDQSRRRALDRLLGRTRSLGTLLDQLLSRALVLHRTDSAPRVTVDLRDVVLDVVEREDHVLLAPGTTVKVAIGDAPILVRADAFSLGEAARNMMANALRHGVPPITIGAESRDGMALLWVEDQGNGPKPEVLAKLGERFNRTASSGETSAGIGLSIVKAVAVAFGGRMETGRDEAGFRIALVLPAARNSK